MKTLLATILLTLSCMGAQADESPIWAGLHKDRRMSVISWCHARSLPSTAASSSDRADAVKFANCIEAQIMGELRLKKLMKAAEVEPERKDWKERF